MQASSGATGSARQMVSATGRGRHSRAGVQRMRAGVQHHQRVHLGAQIDMAAGRGMAFVKLHAAGFIRA